MKSHYFSFNTAHPKAHAGIRVVFKHGLTKRLNALWRVYFKKKKEGKGEGKVHETFVPEHCSVILEVALNIFFFQEKNLHLYVSNTIEWPLLTAAIHPRLWIWRCAMNLLNLCTFPIQILKRRKKTEIWKKDITNFKKFYFTSPSINLFSITASLALHQGCCGLSRRSYFEGWGCTLEKLAA